MTDIWYFANGDQTVGPIDLGALRTALRSNSSPETVLVWKEGFPSWIEARSVPELAKLIVRPPPLPPRIAASALSRNKTISPLSPEYRQPAADDKPKRTVLGWIATLGGWIGGLRWHALWVAFSGYQSC